MSSCPNFVIKWLFGRYCADYISIGSHRVISLKWPLLLRISLEIGESSTTDKEETIKKHRESGMTLVELMITIAVIAISLSMAVPSYQAMMARNRAKTQVNEFIMAINMARSEALRTGSEVSIQAENGGTSDNEFGVGWCVVEDDPGNCSGTVLRRFEALTGAVRLDSREDASSIQFDSLGALSDGVVQKIDLCNSGIPGKRIYINLIGRPKIYQFTETNVDKKPSC